MNKLFFGDNLSVLKHYIRDETVDLIYLDPPFNSNANYNVLFREGGGRDSAAQAEAFQDTWEWGEAAAIAFDEVMRSGGDVAAILGALRGWLGDNAMMAYLAMMAARLAHLHRVLKRGGSLYLHCDPTASHYLKMVLDATFGLPGYKNEIIWLRSKNPKGSQHAMKRFGPATDTIFYYTKGEARAFYPDRIRGVLDAERLAAKYPSVDEHGPYADGPVLRSESMGPRPNLVYDYKGFTPGPAGWRMERAALEALDAKGNLAWTRTGGPRRKLRPEDDKGDPVGSFWGDIPPLNSQARERLGYPTQKPVALLERIIKASSDEGDVILDPFCGCGTTVEAAERLKRNWVGIDVTHYAVTLIEQRLRRAHPGAIYEVNGRPTDLAGARDLARRDKYQFQWWAAWLLGTQSYETKKGADRGIDGNIYFANGPFGYGRIIVSVKGGDHLSPGMVRELSGVVQRENASMGILVTLGEPTRAMLSDAAGAGFVERSAHGRLPRIQIATVGNLLDGKFPKMPPLPPALEDAPTPRRGRDRDQLELLLPMPGAARASEEIVVDPRFMRLGG